MSAVDEPVLAALLLGKAAQAGERGVELVITDDSRTPAAGFLPASDLVTVVGNLLDNAIDASLDGPGEKKVEVLVRPDGADLIISVSDSGPGLPQDAVESAFTRGWSTKVSASAAGRGLGLALVNQVVRKHGGSVVVTDSATGGALFTVRLPLHSLEATAP
jgi:sensor histidine kinase regulating citrate/malate metabolism